MVVRGRKSEDQLEFQGRYEVEHWRNGVLLGIIKGKNLVVNVGKNKILDVMFQSATPIATASWVMGLISDVSYSAIAAADTMGSHAGWTEAVGYSQATRVTWGQGAAASQVTTNASPAVFTINATDTIKGIFITSQSTKGGTSGTLWSAMLFPTGDTNVLSGDELRATYSLGC